MAKKKAQAKAKPAVKASKAVKSAKPKPPADFAKAFQLEIQSVPPPPPNRPPTLDADVAPHFPSSRSVNEALRALVRIVKQVKASP